MQSSQGGQARLSCLNDLLPRCGRLSARMVKRCRCTPSFVAQGWPRAAFPRSRDPDQRNRQDRSTGAMQRKPGLETSAISKRATACWWLSVLRYVTGSGQKQRLANFSPHCLFRGRRTRASRQLQHRRTLTLAQARDQHHLPIREFQRIVMSRGVVHVDLSEAREPLPDLLVAQNAGAKQRLAFDILVERNFGTRQQADRHVR